MAIVYSDGESRKSSSPGDVMKPFVLGLGGDRPTSTQRPVADGGPVAPKSMGLGLSLAGVGTPLVARGGVGVEAKASDEADHALREGEDLLPALKRRLAAWAADLGRPEQRRVILVILGLSALLVYSYFPALVMASVAWGNAQYAHGWIVPLFSAALLFWWHRPAKLPVALSARIVGLAVLVASFALRLAAARYRIVTVDMYTFVPALIGVFLLAGGWSTLGWAWAPLAFLIFMFPLPDEATRYLLGPLQTIATMVSTFALQTLGLEAHREGNQIILGEMHLGVVDACSGLRMLTIFCALAVGLVMVGRRTWWENAVILASAIPIALAVNSIRITVTGVLFQVADSEFAERVFHDWAGLLMMPMAIGMLYLEQMILSSIFLPEAAISGVVSVKPQGHSVGSPAKNAGFSAKTKEGVRSTVVGLSANSSKRGSGAQNQGDQNSSGPMLGIPQRRR